MCADEDEVILRVSKPARMGIDDAPLYPLRPPGNDKLLPIEHDLGLIPSLIAHADLAVFLRVDFLTRSCKKAVN